jgi:ribosomal protein S18 acetylase RimI-like enzyme
MPERRVVRSATEDDLLAISSLDEAIYGERDSYPTLVIRQFFDVFPSLLFVIEDHNDTLAGYSLGAIGRKSDLGWILSVAVRANCRRRGLGRTLCRRLMQELEDHGARSTRLTVGPSNQAAISLYRILGFQVVARHCDYFGTGESRFLMEKAASQQVL